VADRDVDGFAQAIVRLVDEPLLAARLGRAAQAQVEATATWARAAEACERVYAGLLGLGHAGGLCAGEPNLVPVGAEQATLTPGR
jgi:hypothetical protein